MKHRSDGTALIIACKEGHYDVVEYLLSIGADLNEKDCVDQSPLSVATWHENIKLMDLLIENGANPNIKRLCYTPLFDAAYSGRIDAIRTLLTAGADPNVRCDGYDTSLMVAAREGYADIVKELINAGIKKTIKGNKLSLNLAAENGHLDVVKILIEDLNLKPDPNPVKGEYTSESPLQLAVKNGHNEVAAYLLSRDADIEYSCFGAATPLSLASEAGYIDMVNYLLKKGADPNGLGRIHEGLRYPPVYHAAGKNGKVPVFETLLKAGAKLEKKYDDKDYCIDSDSSFGLSRYHIVADHIYEKAVASNNIKIVQYMLTLPDVNIDTFPNAQHSLTPLIIAAARGYFDMVVLLVENGANIHHVSFFDTERRIPHGELGPLTAIYQAVKKGHSNVVSYLYEKGAASEVKSVSELDNSWIITLEAKFKKVRKKFIDGLKKQ